MGRYDFDDIRIDPYNMSGYDERESDFYEDIEVYDVVVPSSDSDPIVYVDGKMTKCDVDFVANCKVHMTVEYVDGYETTINDHWLEKVDVDFEYFYLYKNCEYKSEGPWIVFFDKKKGIGRDSWNARMKKIWDRISLTYTPEAPRPIEEFVKGEAKIYVEEDVF